MLASSVPYSCGLKLESVVIRRCVVLLLFISDCLFPLVGDKTDDSENGTIMILIISISEAVSELMKTLIILPSAAKLNVVICGRWLFKGKLWKA